MATQIQICNRALAHVGRAPITSLSENSPEARACSMQFNTARNELLAAHPWVFATKRRELPVVLGDFDHLVTNPTVIRSVPGTAYPLVSYIFPGATPTQDEVRKVQGPWVHSSQLPSDYLHFIQLNDDALSYKYGAPYQIMGEKIFYDLETAFLTYVYLVTDTERFPPIFARTMEYLVAARIAYPLTREAKLRNDMLALADDHRMKAEVWDMNQMESKVDHVSEFITARG